MKKVLMVCALVGVALLLGGCTQSASRQPQEVVDQYVQARSTADPTGESAQEAEGISPVAPKEVPDYDVQGLSYPMAYAQVNDIARDPQSHVGKTMRIEGVYFGADYPEMGEVIHSILVADSAGCCEVGLEFTVTGNPAWPEDYPPNYSRISLTGVLGTISAGDAIYSLLAVNGIDVVEAAQP